MIKPAPDLRDANQIAISKGMKAAWKRRREAQERMTAAEYKATAKPEKRRKYGNKPVVVDGIKFDSQREARRWGELRALVSTGDVVLLVRQPVYVLAPSVKIAGEARKRPAIRYSADFAYSDGTTGERIVEDVKSTPTAKSKEFRRIQHLMQAVHGISIRIVK